MHLSIIALGHVHAEELSALTPHFERLEQLVLDIPPREAISAHRAELNRALDAASTDWILIMRERETVDAALASEIATAIAAGKSRGFRIRTQPVYAGKDLRLGDPAGEIRLFHRRSYMRYANKGEWDELTIQGSVVRLGNALRGVSFESTAAHREYRANNALPASMLRHILLFLKFAAGVRTVDPNTLRYLWIEAGYDSSGNAAGEVTR